MADITAGGVNFSYFYDANGNMLTGAGRTISYTLFNKPLSISANGSVANFSYDANYERLTKNVTAGGGVVAHTYIGGMYEKIVKSTGTEQRYFIYALGRLVAQVSNNGTTSTTQYAHTDSLGSVDALTIKSGTSYSLAESASFDEYGQPRLNSWAKGTPPLAKTTLGYTGHDMDTEYGLINMNARLYDPLLGRFISADSVIGDVYNAQNLNRYSYVLNNPFGYTDPTGHVANPQADGGVYVEEWGLTIAGNGSGAATLGNAGMTFGTTLGAFQSGLLPSTAYANGVGLEVGNPVSIAQQQATYQQPATITAVQPRDGVARFFPEGAPIITIGETLGAAAAVIQGTITRDRALADVGLQGLIDNRQTIVETAIMIGTMGKGRSSAKGSPEINPRDIAGKTPSEIDQIAQKYGLIKKGSDPQSGKGAYLDPATGQQRIVTHPAPKNGDAAHCHVNNCSGERLDINGNVVPPESPAAHLPLNFP